MKKAGTAGQWRIDSAAIGDWHSGKQPDKRALTIMERHKLLPYTNKARQLRPADFTAYDYIIGMDPENMDDMKGMAPELATARMLMMGDMDHKGARIIRDPYYDRGLEGFEECYKECLLHCHAFYEKVNKGEI